MESDTPTPETINTHITSGANLPIWFSDRLRKVAVYRDELDQLHTCSAVCSHMGSS